MSSGDFFLQHRIASLEQPMNPLAAIEGLDPDIQHFLNVMDSVTPSAVSVNKAGDLKVVPTPVATVEAAESSASNSRILFRLNASWPELVDGPLDRSAQFWVAAPRAAAQPADWPEKHSVPDARHLRPPPTPTRHPSTTPSNAGLFTSTGYGDSQGMWRAYLETNAWSSLYPKPWHVWRLAVPQDARVLELPSAASWTGFVLDYPLRRGRLTYPDWSAVASDWDGVHMSARAVASSHGVELATGSTVIAAPYWGMESTLWLRWVFDSCELVETVEGR